MSMFNKRVATTLTMSCFIAAALSACGSSQTPQAACGVANVAGAKLLPELHSAIMETSADPAGTLKKFQAAADSFRGDTQSVTHAKVKADVDVVSKDLDNLIEAIKDVEAAGKAGKSQDDLHDLVVTHVQPLANTFQQDWNDKLGATCSAP
jgi:hypothetical protein